MTKKIKATITTLSKGSEVIYISQTLEAFQVYLPKDWVIEQSEEGEDVGYQSLLDFLKLENKEDK